MFGKSRLPLSELCKFRNLSTTFGNVPLTEPLSISNPTFRVSVVSSPSAVDVTKLNNGLTIASQNKFGMHCTVGVMIKSGPRYESKTVSGVSHFLEKLGFHSSSGFKDRDHLQAKMESCNSIFDCQISRDFIVYAISGVSKYLKDLIYVLSETVLRPGITEREVNMAARAIGFELGSLEMAPPVEPVLNDLLHSAAFHGNNTLGFPRYCPAKSVGNISRHELLQFMASYYRPERTVIVGVGVDHGELVKYVETFFMPWETSFGREVPEENRLIPDDSLPVYCGGEISVERDLSKYHSPMPEFAHCVIGLESFGSKDPQFVASCLLNSLLGGGGSFSAGGPGKGMYSRLYTNVLNQYHWVNSAQATNHAYADAGIFGVAGSAEPANLDRLVRVLASELRFTAETPISDVELNRAKNQLESMLLMNLEMNPVAFEDIARQILASGEWKPPAYWVEKINTITAEDLRNLLERMFKSPLTLVGFGRMSKWPRYLEIQELIAAPLQTRKHSHSLFKRFL